MDDTVKARNGILTRFWLGRTELWKAFWVLGLLVLLLKIPGIYALDLDPPLAWWYGYVVIIAGAQVFWIVSVWRCAANASMKLWTFLARGVASLVGINLGLSLILLFT